MSDRIKLLDFTKTKCEHHYKVSPEGFPQDRCKLYQKVGITYASRGTLFLCGVHLVVYFNTHLTKELCTSKDHLIPIAITNCNFKDRINPKCNDKNYKRYGFMVRGETYCFRHLTNIINNHLRVCNEGI